MNGRITGIAVLNSELFVVQEKLSQVNVYSTEDYTLTSRDIRIDSWGLWAIIASPPQDCLYISDFVQKVIHRYDLSDNVITQWEVGGECWGLSLTSTDNVLVTLQDKRQIKEYSPDGRMIRTINLDSSMECPRHSIQLPNDQFAVSHGMGTSLHQIYIVDSSGRIINFLR